MLAYNLEHYIAEDGTMSLAPLNFKPGYGGYEKNTCDNDNGILTLAHFIYITDAQVHGLWTISQLGSLSDPGLYHRNPRRTSDAFAINSKDNYIAMAAICIWFEQTTTFKKVIKHWPILNNIDPGTLNLVSKHHPSGVHQPSDWILYYLAAGEKIGWISTTWLAGNLLHQKYFVDPRARIEVKNLAWLKINALERRMDLLTRPQQYIVKGAIERYKDYVASVGGIQTHLAYYGTHHPIFIESRGLVF